jgi:microcystin degradation protein MlrC
MKTLRIAYARIAQETNALSPLLTELSDFERTHYLTGDDLAHACKRNQYEAQGFVKNAELSGFVQELDNHKNIELIPLFSAWAVPSGQLSKGCIQTLTQRLIDAVQSQGPFDALYLSLHGAMRAEEQVDPDGDLLEAMRQTLGEETQIIASLDLHAVLTEHKITQADLLVGYRTNPHRDHKKIGRNCARLLVHLLSKSNQEQVPLPKPHIAWRNLPMILGGGTTLDFFPPMRGIFKRMKEMEKHPNILSVSIYMCQPWHDHPDLGWASYVASEGNDDLAEQYADELADLLWQVRLRQPPAFTPVDQAIDQARKAWLSRKSGAVFFCGCL